MSLRYVSTLNFINSINALHSIIRKNDHKINHLMIKPETPERFDDCINSTT
ncbi:hypothetical protein AAEU31_05965 [Pseudoalteromonas sp. SSMSWG5]|uniref:hypothetical protein n=1 Tax=Pseudoalteromonas sp. SSMSWG5 TaxID=3139396 RepID=UPI003BABDEB3